MSKTTWGSNAPGFSFDFDSVQLCNISQVAGGLINVNTGGDFWLDNSYPYGIHPFSDEPNFTHSPYVGSDDVHDFYQWSGVCTPSGMGDAIWVNCGSMNWSWEQSNAPLWGNPSGALTPGSIIWGLQYTLEWDNVYKNRDPNDGGGGDPGGPTSPGDPGSPGGGARPEMRRKRGGAR